MGPELLRSSEGGLQQAAVAHAAEAAVEGQQAAVDGECVALVNPYGPYWLAWQMCRTRRAPAPRGSNALSHLAST